MIVQARRTKSFWSVVKDRLAWWLVASALSLGAGVVVGYLNAPAVFLGLAGILLVGIMCLLQRDEILAAMIVVASIMLDWYLFPRDPVFAISLAVTYLAYRFLTQSSERTWQTIRFYLLALWAVMLIWELGEIHQSLRLGEGIRYYITVILAVPVMYVVGMQVVDSIARLRMLFEWLSLIGVLIAIHSLIAATTNTFLFITPREASYLAEENNLVLNTGNTRVGSFFLSPDVNGTFLALVLFIALALLVECASIRQRVLHGIEVILIFLALLLTFSTAAIVAMIFGFGVFIIFAARSWRARFIIVAGAGLVPVIGYLAIPRVVKGLLVHATEPRELLLREGVWLTAIHIIAAHPLIGIGLGTESNYLIRSQPYRSALQYVAVYHPHNSFLEYAAMGGIPMLVVFIAIVVGAFWHIVQVQKGLPKRLHVYVYSVYAVGAVITVNSLASNGWTGPTLIPLVWILLGAVSSRALCKDDTSSVGPARFVAGLGSDVAQSHKAQDLQVSFRMSYESPIGNLGENGGDRGP